VLQTQAFEARLVQMLAAEATREDTRFLRIEAAQPLAYLGTVASMERARFKGMMGLATRTAERVLRRPVQVGHRPLEDTQGPPRTRLADRVVPISLPAAMARSRVEYRLAERMSRGVQRRRPIPPHRDDDAPIQCAPFMSALPRCNNPRPATCPEAFPDKPSRARTRMAYRLLYSTRPLQRRRAT